VSLHLDARGPRRGRHPAREQDPVAPGRLHPCRQRDLGPRRRRPARRGEQAKTGERKGKREVSS